MNCTFCRYYARLTLDFQTNKRVCEEVAIIPSKALKNKIAGYTTVRSPHSIYPVISHCLLLIFCLPFLLLPPPRP